VNEHASSSLYDTRRQGYDKGHIGVHGITNQYFACLECKEIGGIGNNAGFS
jgi:hypothetical protein